jgi:hypothetical protein
VLDWNPDDPDTVKVHYDVSGWSIDQRAELSEALATDEVAHVWEGDEVVVPEELEDDVDELFARLEQALGPFAVVLGADEEAVEYGLDEWPPVDRQTLTQALIEAEIPHRWRDTTVYVSADAEEEVDALLDAIEQGTLVLAGADGATAPEGALSTLFTSSDRLAKDPEDHGAGDELRDLIGELEPSAPPYGVSAATWSKALGAAEDLVELLDTDASASDVIGGAQELRGLVRQYV